MKLIHMLVLLLLGWARLQAAETVKIALVGDVKQQQGEAKILSDAGYAVRSFGENELMQLSSQLSNFDLVISGTFCGYPTPAPWEKISRPLREYLNGGGLLLLLNANDHYSLDRVIYHLGAEFRPLFKDCEDSKDQQRATKRTWDQKQTIAMFPHNLAAIFDEYPLWRHLTLPSGWQSLARCSDGGNVTIYRRCGKGMIVASSYFDFNNGRREGLAALVDNLAVAARFEKCDLHIKTFEMETSYGPGKAKLVLTAMTERNPVSGTLKIQLNNRILSERRYVGTSTAGRNIELCSEYEITSPGTLDVNLAATSKKGTATVQFSRKVVPPLAVMPWRDEVYPMIAGKFPFFVTLDKEFSAPDKYRLEFQCKDQLLDVRKAAENLYLCNMTSVPPGEYPLKVTLRSVRDGKALFRIPPLEIRIKDRNPRYAVTTEGNMMVESKKVFPVGIYHVSWQLSDESRSAAIDFAKEGGYNLIHPSRRPADPGFPAFMKRAAEAGIMVIVEGGSPPDDAHYAALAGWNLVDEPELHNVLPATLLQMKEQLRRHDSEHLTYMVMMTKSGLRNEYLRCADLVGHDPYPIPGQPISLVYHNIGELVHQLDGTSHLPVAVLQAFGYPKEKNCFSRVPTPQEVRNMTYQAIIAGCRGIIYYTVEDPGFRLNDYPALRKELVRIPREITDIEDFLLNGQRVKLETPVKELYASRWLLDKRSLTIIVNCSAHPVQAPIMGQPVNLAALEVKIILSSPSDRLPATRTP